MISANYFSWWDIAAATAKYSTIYARKRIPEKKSNILGDYIFDFEL